MKYLNKIRSAVLLATMLIMTGTATPHAQSVAIHGLTIGETEYVKVSVQVKRNQLKEV